MRSAPSRASLSPQPGSSKPYILPGNPSLPTDSDSEATMSAMSSASAAAAASKVPRILACVLCQHRKIKCDKNSPCANCVKANVQCIASTPAPARKRRRPNQDLQERLARCEELLKEYSAGGKPPPSSLTSPSTPPLSLQGLSLQQKLPAAPPTKAVPQTRTPESTQRTASQSSLPSQPSAESESPTASSSSTTAPPMFDDPYMRFKPQGKLIKEDGGVRFIDGFLWSHVYDELRAMKTILDEEEKEEDAASWTPEESNTPEQNSELLLAETTTASLDDLHPEPAQVIKLWQIYLERVNPLTKIIHVPTLQPYVIEAAGASRGIPLNVESLLFAIYTISVVALSPEECIRLLDCPKEDAIKRFSRGVRIALMKLGFLTSYDLVVLQALVLYLNSLVGRYDRHGAWILNGVIIRIAQKMGLHRDGEILGLSPFEAEMRRRVWWQIIMLDAKYALMSGLSHSLLPRSWDTREPLNINDEDLIPNSTAPLKARDGPTDMLFCLVTNKVAKLLVKSPGIEYFITQSSTDYSEPMFKQLNMYRDLLEELSESIDETIEKYCDPSAGPLHQLGSQLKSLICDKLWEVVRPPREHPEWGTEIFTPIDNLFKIAVATTDHNLRAYKAVVELGFLWFFTAHLQMDVLIYMVGQLSTRTTGSLVDRAWNCLEETYKYHPELHDTSDKRHMVLAVFAIRGWRVRSAALAAANGGFPPPLPDYLRKLRVPTSSNASSSAVQSSEPFAANAATARAGSMDTEMKTETVTATVAGSESGQGFNPADLSVDQFFTGLLDITVLDWDMFGSMPSTGQFGAFGGGFGSGGPEW